MTDVEKSKKLAELSKKKESAEREKEQYKKFLESDIKFGRETTNSRIDYEYAVKNYERIKKEIDSLM